MSSEHIEVAPNFQEARRRFQERFSVLPLANSVDGRTFSFRGPLTLFLNPGAYVRIVTNDGVALLGQVHERALFDIEGPEVKVTDESADLGQHGISVNEARIRLQSSIVRGSGVILYQIAPTPGPSTLPGFADAEISLPSAADMEINHAQWAKGRSTLEIGGMRGADVDLPALIDARGFNRHTFLCGQSGSGKTYSLGVVLEQLLMHTNLRVAVLDPNADYVRLGKLNSARADAAAEGVGKDDVARFERRLSDLQVLRPHADAGDGSEPLRIRYSDLSRDDQAKVLSLDPLDDREEYEASRKLASSLGGNGYDLGEFQQAGLSDLSVATRQLLLRIANLGVDEWTVWAHDGQASLADRLNADWRSIVLDVSRFERPIERSVVALAMLRHFWNKRESREPVLLVIDEAHNVCPDKPMDPIQQAATELAISIAGEGRKYGIYLLLSTQRPDKLHPNVVSQCDNLILMRMNSVIDLGDLQRIFSFVPAAIIGESLAFKQGEALIAGKLVATPLLAKMGRRFSEEGGADVPTTWANSVDL
ncbi:MAG: ATP-binding protein [Thermomicrobiales bacterium]